MAITADPTLLPAPEQFRRRFRVVLLLLGLAFVTAMFIASFSSVDVTEYGLITRFGAIVRVVAEPGLHLKAPFDRVVRLDKRLAFSQPAQAEYLTVDKRNVVVESLATWRIADPKRFRETLATRAGADVRLADAIVGEIGAVVGRYQASSLISASRATNRYQQIVAEVREDVARFVRPTYGIEIVDIDILRLSLPEQNRDHVFERMKAERGKIAKEYRSVGELEARKIIAQADRERSHIDTEAYAQAQRLKAEGDAEAARIYQTAFSQNPRFYKFLRTLRSYEKFLDENTTLFLPAEAEVFEMLRPQLQSTRDTARAPAPQSRAAVSKRRNPKAPGIEANLNRRNPETASSEVFFQKPEAKLP